jgi:hypothetical protein
MWSTLASLFNNAGLSSELGQCADEHVSTQGSAKTLCKMYPGLVMMSVHPDSRAIEQLHQCSCIRTPEYGGGVVGKQFISTITMKTINVQICMFLLIYALHITYASAQELPSAVTHPTNEATCAIQARDFRAGCIRWCAEEPSEHHNFGVISAMSELQTKVYRPEYSRSRISVDRHGRATRALTDKPHPAWRHRAATTKCTVSHPRC